VGQLAIAGGLFLLLLIGVPLALWAMVHTPGAASTPPDVVPTNPPSAGSFTLEQPPGQTWNIGSTPKLLIHVVRDKWNEKIELHLAVGALPVTISEATIPGDKLTVEVPVSINEGARAAVGQVSLHATSGKLQQDVSFEVRIVPRSAGVWLPPKFQPVAGTQVVPVEDQRELYKEIESKLPDVPATVFVLVPHKQEGDPPSYYMMQNRMTNELYLALVPNGNKPKDTRPAIGLTADQAEAAAQILGGHLPRALQYDKAIDFTPEKSGPAKSPFGIRDLEAKGLEMTRDLTAEVGTEAASQKIAGKTLPLANPPNGTLVILRGRLSSSHELRYEDLEYQQSTPHVKRYTLPGYYNSFRVVIEP
jgi:hypothetical protein